MACLIFVGDPPLVGSFGWWVVFHIGLLRLTGWLDAYYDSLSSFFVAFLMDCLLSSLVAPRMEMGLRGEREPCGKYRCKLERKILCENRDDEDNE